MKKIVLFAIGAIITASTFLSSSNKVHAWECFTGPTYLHDSRVEIKTAVYLRSGPCSENSGPNKTERGVVLKPGQMVTAIATNHRWHKVKTDDGQIGWIWIDFIKTFHTKDSFAGQNIESTRDPYGMSDTHAEFPHLFWKVATTTTTNNDNDYVAPKQYNVSSRTKAKLDKMLTKVKTAIKNKSDSNIEQKAVVRIVIAKLENLQEKKSELKDILEYLIDKLTDFKNTL